MKKILSMFAIAMMSISLFTACSNDDDTPNDDNGSQPVDVSEGVYIINAGNKGNAINGSITYINTTSNKATQGVFKTVNGRELGITINDAVVYGSKMYIVVTGENTVEVVDRNTMKSIKQIKTTDLMGADKGLNPRHVIAYDGKVYVSTYGTNPGWSADGTIKGYVAAIDTTSFTGTTYSVGAYPEGMAVNNGKLYVANSSYATGSAPSISEVDLSTGSVNDIKDKLITNPVNIEAVDGVLYILDSGLYDANNNQSGQGVRKYENGTFTKLADATMMAVSNVKLTRNVAKNSPKIYMINNPYTSPATEITYSVYDTATGKTSKFIDGSDIYSPNAIAIDPVTGKIYILSYNENADTHKADYLAPGYVVEYSSNGTKLNKYDTGVGPTAITFNTAVKYVVNE